MSLSELSFLSYCDISVNDGVLLENLGVLVKKWEVFFY